MMNKTLSGFVLAAGISLASAPASAIIVGGIDFGSPGTTHLETATLAQTFVNAAGQTLQGYGLLTTVNGSTSYCADGTANCSLYFSYEYTVGGFNPLGSVVFSEGTVDIYYSDAAAVNLLTAQNSAANLTFIQGLDEWARFNGHIFADPFFNVIDGFLGNTLADTYVLNGYGDLTGTSLSVTGKGLADVDTTGAFGLASVASYLDGNSEGDGLGGFADLTITTSANNSVLNAFDVADGLAETCKTNPTVGQWCFQGTLNTRGDTNVVPEPGSLALLSIGLLGIGAVARRRSAQRA